MRFIVVVTSCFLGASGCTGQNLEELGHPILNTSIVVEWQIRTNKLPATVSVYKVGPAKWTPAFLSNVVHLLGFKHSEAWKEIAPAAKGRQVLYTDDPAVKPRRNVLFQPSNGRFFFHNDYAIPLPRQPVQEVLSEEQVMGKALAILSRLGVATNELRTKPGSPELFRMREVRTRASGREPEKKIIARGVHLFRAVDGIGVGGIGVCGGIRVNYGNHGRIAELELVWRNFHSPRRERTADTNQITKWIRAGRAVIETDVNPSAISSLTITNATVLYLGHNGSVPQRVMYPLVNLGAIADIDGKKINVSVNAPIIAD